MEQEGVWDLIGESWQKFRTRLSPTVEKFVSGKKGKILDVGCGSGRNFFKVDGLEWYGVDFSNVMLEYAGGKDYVELKKGVAEDLSYGDEFFDVVLCYAVLHCVDSSEKRNRALKEIFRVLKKGGEALISGWGRKSPRLKSKEKECFVPWGVREGRGRVERYTYVYDLDELIRDCELVGFEVVRAWEERNVNVVVRKIS